MDEKSDEAAVLQSKLPRVQPAIDYVRTCCRIRRQGEAVPYSSAFYGVFCTADALKQLLVTTHINIVCLVLPPHADAITIII